MSHVTNRMGELTDDSTPAPGNMHFDDLNKLRVLPSDVSDETTSLRDECKEFIDSKYITAIKLQHSVSSETQHSQWPYIIIL